MTDSEKVPTTGDKSDKPTVKLIDKIINYRSEHGKPFFSLEFFPPRNEAELTSLWLLLDQLSKGSPLFMDITWHSRASLDPNDQLSSLAVAGTTISKFNHETVLHLTCYDYDVTTLELILSSAKSLGICNILALRGDIPDDKKDQCNTINGDSNGNVDKNEVKIDQQATPTDLSSSISVTKSPPPQITDDVKKSDQPDSSQRNNFADLSCALGLVKFIRTKYNDYFTIGVAGYPMGHPDGISYTDDLAYLKAKVDAGADFIVTQLSFTADQYITFIKDCRSIGIKIPIIPGIFPIQTKVSVRNIAKLTKVEPPENVKNAVEACKGDMKAISEYGLKHTVDLCKKLLESDVDIPGLHFYTLNRDNCITDTLKQINLWNLISNQSDKTSKQTDITNISKILPNGGAETNVTVEANVLVNDNSLTIQLQD